jgi:hypothetical protein
MGCRELFYININQVAVWICFLTGGIWVMESKHY